MARARAEVVSLHVDGLLEASYTVADDGSPPATPQAGGALHEAVLFGSGDDFNGMSALLGAIYFYKHRALLPRDLAVDASLHTPLPVPPSLARPLTHIPG